MKITNSEKLKVLHIMDMWIDIEESFENLNEEDQNKIKEILKGHEPKFENFDTYKELEYRQVSLGLVNKHISRFSRFRNREGIQPHTRILEQYENMLAHYYDIILNTDEASKKLSVDCLISLLEKEKYTHNL